MGQAATGEAAVGQTAMAFALLVLCSFAVLPAPAGAQSGVPGLLEPTIQTHTGPWYQPGAPQVESLWAPGDRGRSLHMRGRVLSTSGVPLEGALVEMWHTDHGGNYPPLRASLRTGKSGTFGIRTVLPGHNQGYRARHIHFAISHADHLRLITRIYFLGDPNIDEAMYPELTTVLEEGELDGAPTLFGHAVFVLQPR